MKKKKPKSLLAVQDNDWKYLRRQVALNKSLQDVRENPAHGVRGQISEPHHAEVSQQTWTDFISTYRVRVFSVHRRVNVADEGLPPPGGAQADTQTMSCTFLKKSLLTS